MSDDIYYDLHREDDGEDSYTPQSKWGKILAFFFKSVFMIIFIGLIAFFLYRIISMTDPAMSDDIWANGTMLEAINKHKSETVDPAYNEYYIDYLTFQSVRIIRHKDSDMKVLTRDEYGYQGFEVLYQDLHSYFYTNPETGKTESVELSEYYDVKNHPDEGDLRVFNMYFMPQSGQLMVTYRINADAYKNLHNAYPQTKDIDEPFLFAISDESGNIYDSVSYKKLQRMGYTYYRFLFDGIDYSTVSKLTLDVYLKHEVDKAREDVLSAQDITPTPTPDKTPVSTPTSTPTSTPASTPTGTSKPSGQNKVMPYRSLTVYDSNISLKVKDIKLPVSLTELKKQEDSVVVK